MVDIFVPSDRTNIFFNENVWISINISLKFVPMSPISNIPTLVQVMAWRRPDDKPLYKPMMSRLPTHICVTRPQWVKWKRCINTILIWFKFISMVWLARNSFSKLCYTIHVLLPPNAWKHPHCKMIIKYIRVEGMAYRKACCGQK